MSKIVIKPFVIGVPSKIVTGGNLYYQRVAYLLKKNYNAKIKIVDKESYNYKYSFSIILEAVISSNRVIVSPSSLTRENFFIALLNKRNNKRIVIIQEEEWKYGSFSFLKKITYGFFLRNADVIISCSDKLKNIMIKQFKVNPTIIKTLNPPLLFSSDKKNNNKNNFKKKGDVLKLLCVSRLEPRKRVLELIKLLNESNLNYELIIAGKIDEESEYVKKIRLLINNNVHLMGAVEKNVLSELYLSADILIHTATTEAFGMVILESLAHGCPVLCSDKITAELKELSGILTLKIDDVNDLESIKNTLSNKEKLKSLKINAINNRKNLLPDLGWDRFDNQLLSFTKKLI